MVICHANATFCFSVGSCWVVGFANAMLMLPRICVRWLEKKKIFTTWWWKMVMNPMVESIKNHQVNKIQPLPSLKLTVRPWKCRPPAKGDSYFREGTFIKNTPYRVHTLNPPNPEGHRLDHEIWNNAMELAALTTRLAKRGIEKTWWPRSPWVYSDDEWELVSCELKIIKYSIGFSRRNRRKKIPRLNSLLRKHIECI